jgi:chemotaxis signal transduction protein
MSESIVPATRGVELLKRQSISAAPSKTYVEDLGVICFTMDGTEFGINLDLVFQIVKPPPLTRVPRVAAHILGVISIRGAPVTLFDLRQVMGLPKTDWPRSARVLVVEMGSEQIGLLVDSVTLVRRLRQDQIELNPDLKDSSHAEQVLCIGRPDARTRVIVVDLDIVLGERIK